MIRTRFEEDVARRDHWGRNGEDGSDGSFISDCWKGHQSYITKCFRRLDER